MTLQNNGSLFNPLPAMPIGDSEEGKTWAAFWQAQAEWTVKVAGTPPPAVPAPKPEPER
jgi:hypothetical protein